jgi:hypothetical protein
VQWVPDVFFAMGLINLRADEAAVPEHAEDPARS